jgi:hypothetical protein
VLVLALTVLVLVLAVLAFLHVSMATPLSRSEQELLDVYRRYALIAFNFWQTS